MLGKNKNEVLYDSLQTLYGIATIDKTTGLYPLFNEILEKEYMPIKDFFDDDCEPEIIWMDYRENYIIPDKISNSITDDIGEDDEDEEGFPRIFNMGMFGGQELINITPWGRFTDNDPMNPMNLYDDIQVIHFKGFDFSAFRGLESAMNSIRGVAKWSIIDKYSAIICIAKHYNLTEVKKNVENVIYSSLNFKKFNTYDELAIEAQLMSEQSEEENFVIVFPNKTLKKISNPSDQDIKDVNDILINIPDCLIFKNGDLYEHE